MTPKNLPIDFQGYFSFLEKRKKDLQRIVRKSGRMYELEELQNEVLITADEVSRKTGRPVDFSDPEQGKLLIAYTYQRLIRYSDTKSFYAKSLDQPGPNGDSPVLIESMTNGLQENPPPIFAEEDAEEHELNDHQRHQSIGCAWAALLKHCNNRMVMVSYFLRLSLSHSYRCYNRVLNTTRHQHHLPLILPDNMPFAPRPWRRSRLYRTPVQMTFEFEKPLLE